MNSESNPADLVAAVVDGPGAPVAAVAVGAQPADPNPWILGWWRDLVFFIGTPLLIGPLVLLPQSLALVAPLYLFVATFIAVGHQLPGFLRVYGDGELVASFRGRLTIAPILLLAVGLLCSLLALEALTIILLVWGTWHVATQAYGFARIYDAKVGSFAKTTVRLDFAMCLCWFGAGLVFSPSRAEQLLRLFYQAGGPLIPPLAFQAVQLVLGGLTAAVTLAFAMDYLSQRARGQHASLIKLLAMASSFGFWWFAMVNVSDVLLGILMFELFHGVQYLALVLGYGRRRAEQAGEGMPTLRFIFRPGVTWMGLYVALALIYGLPAFLVGVTPFGIDYGQITDAARRAMYGLIAASTMLHFYLDGFTWRLRDERVRRALGLPAKGLDAGVARSLGSSIPHAVKWACLLVPLALLGWTQRSRDVTLPEAYVNLAEALPQSWRAHAQLGRSLVDQGRSAEGAEELLIALEINPDEAATLCDLGRALRQLGRVEESLKQFQRAVELAPEMYAAQAELGKTLFGVGNAEEGLTHLLKAQELNPLDPTASHDLGLAQAKLGKLDDALKSFTRAIELDNLMADAFNARGIVYWNTGKLDEAQTDFTEAIRLAPEMAKAYRNRAGLWLSKDDRTQAIADYTSAIAADGTNSMDYVMRGRIYDSLQQYDKARADYLDGLRRKGSNLEATRSLVTMFLNCPDESYRDPEQAILLAQSACQMSNWQDLSALSMLSASCAAAGDYDQAIRWQQQGIETLPPDAPASLRESLQKQLDDYKTAKLSQSSDGKNAVPQSKPAAEGVSSGGDGQTEGPAAKK